MTPHTWVKLTESVGRNDWHTLDETILEEEICTRCGAISETDKDAPSGRSRPYNHNGVYLSNDCDFEYVVRPVLGD